MTVRKRLFLFCKGFNKRLIKIVRLCELNSLNKTFNDCFNELEKCKTNIMVSYS